MLLLYQLFIVWWATSATCFSLRLQHYHGRLWCLFPACTCMYACIYVCVFMHARYITPHVCLRLRMYSIQEVLNDASQVLFQATGYRAYFKEVTILVPTSWNMPTAQPATVESFDKASLSIFVYHNLSLVGKNIGLYYSNIFIFTLSHSHLIYM